MAGPNLLGPGDLNIGPGNLQHVAISQAVGASIKVAPRMIGAPAIEQAAVVVLGYPKLPPNRNGYSIQGSIAVAVIVGKIDVMDDIVAAPEKASALLWVVPSLIVREQKDLFVAMAGSVNIAGEPKVGGIGNEEAVPNNHDSLCPGEALQPHDAAVKMAIMAARLELHDLACGHVRLPDACGENGDMFNHPRVEVPKLHLPEITFPVVGRRDGILDDWIGGHQLDLEARGQLESLHFLIGRERGRRRRMPSRIGGGKLRALFRPVAELGPER